MIDDIKINTKITTQQRAKRFKNLLRMISVYIDIVIFNDIYILRWKSGKILFKALEIGGMNLTIPPVEKVEKVEK